MPSTLFSLPCWQKLTKNILYALATYFLAYQPSIAPHQKKPSKKNCITLSNAEAHEIGTKIWRNETGGSIEKLTWWGDEEFASLGIGHFIWFPAQEPKTFTQTFPDLIIFLKKNGKVIPRWLSRNPKQSCPWKNREQFFAEIQTARMKKLRTVLARTIDLQVRFIIQRLEQVFPAILKTVQPSQQEHLKIQFYRIAKSPNGIYALLDYVNFKGEGTNKKEGYKQQGWGLKQILLAMKGFDISQKATEEFAAIAKKLLTERVKNAPAERHEEKFLAGWKNRIDTYTAR